MADTIVTLKKGEGRTIKAGGAWIYDNEIDTIAGKFTNGDVVTVHDFDGYPMGKGFINQNSKIRVRMLTRKADVEIDRDFLRMRVQNAWDYRKTIVMSTSDLNSLRIIFGEADWLPGLVVDKYDDILVVECLALGMEKLKATILEELVNIMSNDGCHIRGIYERSDAPVRKKEGMMPYKGFLYSDAAAGSTEFLNGGEFDTNVEIIENGVHYMVDVVNGQKTGFFLDQKYNRLAMQNICRNLALGLHNSDADPASGTYSSEAVASEPLRILDCFTHMGTFALNIGLAVKNAGCTYASVTGLDISEYAVAQATANARLNNLQDIVGFRCANVLDELPRLCAAGEKYDVVVLDPPAFTKSREATKNAIKGYREINIKGLKLVKDGGYFASCSCSHFMTQELFTKTIGEAAKSAHKRLRQIEFRTQAPDHPILWSADESYYLKFYIFQVVDEK